ncbi:MAG: tetratricopeptide repeat protein [Candidatus Competibacteraceae bacterium]|nr:tetratricopeptide repeat protein [Candidatus Competibacteraceae bacterium]
MAAKIIPMGKNETDETLVDIGGTYEKAVNFYNKYKKQLTIGLGAIVVLVGGYMYYAEMIKKPKERKAFEELFTAEFYFAKDSFNLALQGREGEFYGFLQVIDEFGSTKAGNLAQYYAGICYLQTGKFEEAIEHLKKFSSSDVILSPLALGCIGDAYRELGQSEDAVKYYEKAAADNNNSFTAPLYLKKAGMTYEEDLKNPEKALKIYRKIQDEYSNTTEGRDIGKFITRIEFAQQ